MAWSQTAELKLVDHEENGRRTPLIRDWSDVFLELGDKQSLLASLKESQFFKAFEDQGITYEVGKVVLLVMPGDGWADDVGSTEVYSSKHSVLV